MVLVVGDEEFLVERAVEQVTAQRRADDPSAETTEIDGPVVVAAQLYELLGPSLFGGSRTVVVRSAQDVPTAAIPALTSFLADPGEDVTLVIQHTGGARGKALLTAARSSAAATISCARLTRGAEREAFVRAEAKRVRARIAADAVSRLVDAVGTDLRELAAVTAQLASDCGGSIDSRAVAAYHRGRAQVSGFTVADAAVAGDLAGALENLRWALSVGVAPVLVADALADGIRTVAKVAAAGRGNAYATASALGMPPWKVERAQRQAHGWSAAGLDAAMQCVAGLNADVKGAAADAGYALERALRTLVDLRGPA